MMRWLPALILTLSACTGAPAPTEPEPTAPVVAEPPAAPASAPAPATPLGRFIPPDTAEFLAHGPAVSLCERSAVLPFRSTTGRAWPATWRADFSLSSAFSPSLG